MHDESPADGLDGPVRRPTWSTPRLRRFEARDTIQINIGIFADGGSPSEGAS